MAGWAALPAAPRSVPPDFCLSGTGGRQSHSRAQGPTACPPVPRQSPGPGVGRPSVPGCSEGRAGKRPGWASGSGRRARGLPGPGTGAPTRGGDLGFPWRVPASCTDSLLGGQELAGAGRAPVPRGRVLLALWVPVFFFFLIIIYLFICGCVGSSFLCEGLLQPRQTGATLHRGARASHYRGLSCCGAQAPDAHAQ